ncbi:DUF1707 and DUF4190 domain-containing protein [Kitasatospora sp. NPDC058965]|uniref:DUF1707 and DUF4190 domain-containing protein n=1 Tax=Kitasatospora sp. NPDC058965 TaxID=3346682 RepID=UPI00367794F8
MGDVQPWPRGGYPAAPYPAPGPYPAATPAHAAMRAAHADRERTVDVLKAAYAEGRLSADEYSQRFDATHAAQTYGQLAQLVADLPSGPMVAPLAAPLAAAVPPTFMPPPTRPVPNNSLAVGSMVLGLLCVPTMGLTGLPAVITGHIARTQIRRTKEGGDGMATAGLVLGYLSVAGWALLFLLGVFAFAAHS